MQDLDAGEDKAYQRQSLKTAETPGMQSQTREGIHDHAPAFCCPMSMPMQDIALSLRTGNCASRAQRMVRVAVESLAGAQRVRCESGAVVQSIAQSAKSAKSGYNNTIIRKSNVVSLR